MRKIDLRAERREASVRANVRCRYGHTHAVLMHLLGQLSDTSLRLLFGRQELRRTILSQEGLLRLQARLMQDVRNIAQKHAGSATVLSPQHFRVSPESAISLSFIQ